jgi:hypothetical protein
MPDAVLFISLITIVFVSLLVTTVHGERWMDGCTIAIMEDRRALVTSMSITYICNGKMASNTSIFFNRQ